MRGIRVVELRRTIRPRRCPGGVGPSRGLAYSGLVQAAVKALPGGALGRLPVWRTISGYVAVTGGNGHIDCGFAIAAVGSMLVAIC